MGVPSRPAKSGPREIGLTRVDATTLMDRPESVVSGDSSVELTLRIPQGTNYDRYFLLAVPAGEKRCEIKDVSLRDPRDGATYDTQTSPTMLRDVSTLHEISARLDFRSLGFARRNELGRLKVRLRDPLTAFGTPLEIASLVVRIERPSTAYVPQHDDEHDSAIEDPASPYREFLERAVCNPEALPKYRTLPPLSSPIETEAPAIPWQTPPETSPGFPWIRIPVEKDGLYTIDAAWLRAAGVDPDTIAPESVRVFSLGVEVPIEPVLPGKVSFANGQRMMFYGLAGTGVESLIRPYYVGRAPEGTVPKRFTPAAAATGSEVDADRFRRTTVIEQDEKLETRVGSFLSIKGMTWVWKQLDDQTTQTIPFEMPGLVSDARETTMQLVLYYAAASIPGSISARTNLNGEELKTGFLPSTAKLTDIPQFTVPIRQGLARASGNQLTLILKPAVPLPGAEFPSVFLDQFALAYDSYLDGGSGLLDLHGGDLAPIRNGSGARLRTRGFRPYRLNALDVTDPAQPGRLNVAADRGDQVVTVPQGMYHHYLLADDDHIARAPAGSAVRTQPFDAAKASADTVIIYHSRFEQAAQLLAEDLRAAGQEVLLADVGDLYERYTAGVLSLGAIRDFLRDLVTKSSGRRPYQVVLIGDTTSDGHNLSRSSVENFIPTFSFTDPRRREKDQFATDQVYAWLCGQDELADLLVGRLSVNTPESAMAEVRKLIAYRQLHDQPWARRAITVSDYGVFEEKARHLHVADVAPSFDHRILAVSRRAWEDNYFLPANVLQPEDKKVAPLVTGEIQKAFDEGTGVISFFGHGAPNLWSNQRIWFGGDSENSDNLLLKSTGHPAFVTSYTCNNGAIDYPMPRWNVCIAEDMMRVPGGAIGVFMPSGPGFPEQHIHFASAFMRMLTEGKVRRLGVVSELARLFYIGHEGNDDHSRMYIYLGVPTMELPTPREELDVAVSAIEKPGEVNWEFSVRADEELTSGVVELHSPDGDFYSNSPLAIEGKSASATLHPPDIDPEDGPIEALVMATTARGTVIFGGKHIPLEAQQVSIEDIAPRPLEAGSTARTLDVSIYNPSSLPVAGELIARVDVSGARETRVPYRLHGGTRAKIPMRIKPAQSGAFPVEFWTSNTSSRIAWRESYPASLVRRVFAFGAQEGPAIQVPSREVFLKSQPGYNSQPIWQFPIANVGSIPLSRLKLDVDVEIPPGSKPSSGPTLPIPEMAPGESRYVTSSVAVPRETKEPILVRAKLSSGLQEELPAPIEISRIIEPSEFPDLALAPDSLHVTPDRPIQGTTVFVSARIVNLGGDMHSPSRAALQVEQDNGKASMASSMTGNPEGEIPPLRHGAFHDVKFRWDPDDQVGPVHLWLWIDSQDSLVESDKSNNRVAVDFTLRTKWKLQAGPIEVRKMAEPGKRVLRAFVGNAGETDARQVLVRFYRNDKQTPANLIGEVVVPRVGALSTQPVEFVWTLPEDELAIQKPTYSIAIKGSLQRVSSATQ